MPYKWQLILFAVLICLGGSRTRSATCDQTWFWMGVLGHAGGEFSMSARQACRGATFRGVFQDQTLDGFAMSGVSIEAGAGFATVYAWNPSLQRCGLI